MHSFGFLLVPAAGGQDLVVMLVVQGLHALADASGEVDRGFALLCDHRLAEHYAYRGPAGCGPAASLGHRLVDRKSTRLNSSHVAISYAVFCLKKKKIRTCMLLNSTNT